ncbi:hypothetical protein VCR4J5_180123 [Vibrio crassostreae]|uniref:Uncharacterized protein n=1 Tax=Vibrio crassostreae TaxID=246167 RepID=A0A822MX39_9VIBR|nr:hypothetical protein VCR4J5_180123 [Vibrio crassostreae]CDT31357.1 hypothetical protein VCR9J2_50092 [Vibrio crassostreae]CDT43659.1 hypothetical protein VCR15J5_610167 [Vibrio crassostreae]CDT45435.1 hypothetical protein VCR5J5_320157 [Vibrio crassostreae]CDT62034.1 hypothetical protein VCR20J5_700020 [Vibrio crassostreae]
MRRFKDVGRVSFLEISMLGYTQNVRAIGLLAMIV